MNYAQSPPTVVRRLFKNIHTFINNRKKYINVRFFIDNSKKIKLPIKNLNIFYTITQTRINS